VDHESDSVWIKPLEATPLSAYEETKTQASVSTEGDMTNGVGRDG
jgi:hypothetical protein